MEDLYLALVLFLPLVGSAASFIFGLKRPKLSGYIASFAILAAFVFACMAASPLLLDTRWSNRVELFTWISVVSLDISFALFLDSLSALMLFIITGVGSLIHIYSIGYMSKDPSTARYFAYLNLFVFFMLLLVLGDNLLVLFAGWEGVGLCSYLLIGFWHKNKDYAAAGKKAFIVNRIGDAGFLIGIFSLVLLVGSCDFSNIQSWVDNSLINPHPLLKLAAIGLFIGVTGKSAQIPLYIWLPDAMAGPTPVSALIHAATMVTAGVYLLARMSYLFDLFPELQFIIYCIAIATALLAALIALFQNDLKKILAYSTVSQLGFMFMASSMGAHWIALFHVTTHAFFKAGLFLAAGNIINACHHEQDIRKMGGLVKKLPLTFIAYLICVLAISGIYPLAGYFSKHEIFNLFADSDRILIISVIAALTVIYMTRSLVLVFFGSPRSEVAVDTEKNSAFMIVPVLLLAVLAACSGPFLSHFLPELFALKMNHEAVTFSLGLNDSLKSVALFIVTLLLFWKLNFIVSKLNQYLSWILIFPKRKFFIDEVYSLLIVKPLRQIARILQSIFENAVIDSSFRGLGVLSIVTGHCFSLLHSGQLRSYLTAIIIASVLMVSICLMV